MPKITKIIRIVPDAGRHLVTLKEVNEIDNKFFDPKTQREEYKTQFEWIFSYTDKPGMEIRAFSTKAPSRYKGKTNRMLEIEEALLAKALTEKEWTEIDDTDALLGMACNITVKHEKDDDGQVSAKIVLFEPESSK